MTIAPRRFGSRGAKPALPALAGCLALLALAMSGCGGDDGERSAAGGGASAAPAAKSAVTVDIASFKFMPGTTKVKTGGTVTFVNRDKAAHTAQTGLNPKTAKFDTDRLEKGDKKAVKLKDAGRFEYFCAYHRFMEGAVEVVE